VGLACRLSKDTFCLINVTKEGKGCFLGGMVSKAAQTAVKTVEFSMTIKTSPSFEVARQLKSLI
jgi:hypothetical protein